MIRTESLAVSFPVRFTAESRLLRVRSGHAEVEFSESEIVGILKDAKSGIPVADLLRKYGVSKATFFKCRSKYGGASMSDVKRLRELETENAKLKRMYADLAVVLDFNRRGKT